MDLAKYSGINLITFLGFPKEMKESSGPKRAMKSSLTLLVVGRLGLSRFGLQGRNSTLTRSRRLNLVLSKFGHI